VCRIAEQRSSSVDPGREEGQRSQLPAKNWLVRQFKEFQVSRVKIFEFIQYLERLISSAFHIS
jgi:hypothetical protein